MNLSATLRRLCGAVAVCATLSAQAPETHLPPQELALWRDPAFQQRFRDSYLAVTDIEPKLDDDEREQMQTVLETIAKDQMDQAATLLAKLRVDGKNAVYDFMLGNIHFQREELEPALACYRAAVERFPRFRRAWHNLARIHARRGEFAQAVPALSRVIELGGGDADTYGLLGYATGALDNPIAAESAFRMASLLAPNSPDWQMGLARSFFKQRRYADAVALTTTMLAGQPDRADLWLLQGNAWLGLEQPRKAAESFELVDRLGRSTQDSLSMLGDIYTNLELFDLAVSAYRRVLAMGADVKVDRPLRAAKSLVARGAAEPARQLMAAIDEHAGKRLSTEEQKDLLKLRARLAVAAGAGEEEAKVLAEIVALDPLDGEALILLGQHANRTGNAEQAVFYFERAASLEKFEADAKVRHAQLLVGQGKYQAALPLLRRAQTLKPRDTIQQYLEQVERVAQGR